MPIPVTQGNCTGCEAPIWLVERGRLKSPLGNYQEFFMALSNNRMSPHAICKHCVQKLTDAKVDEIFARIKESWKQAMVGFATIEQFIDLNALRVVAWDLDEKECEKKYEQKIKQSKIS